MGYIDLRSDTVTNPTANMRRAIAEAIVGDDVYGDDPTVALLEKKAAEILGKQAALFVPSGTMGNQLCIMTHTKRGDEIILGDNCHIVVHEVGAAAILSNVSFKALKTENDIPNPHLIKSSIRSKNIHFPDTGLICLENALSTGRVVGLDIMSQIFDIARENRIPVHLDGARIFNAAHALNVSAKDIASYADSVMFCLSKGLCAPVGSMVCGTYDFIERARKNRKILGGGMRQAGILAAAGIVALDEMVDRLVLDHENAKYMAALLSKIPRVSLDIDSVQINMVFFKVRAAEKLLSEIPDIFLKNNIKINEIDEGLFRFVTSNEVSKSDIERAVELLESILKK